MNSGKVFGFLVLGVAITILAIALPIGASHSETDMSAVDAKLANFIHNEIPMSAVDAKLGNFIHNEIPMSAVDAKLGQFIFEDSGLFQLQATVDYFARH